MGKNLYPVDMAVLALLAVAQRDGRDGPRAIDVVARGIVPNIKSVVRCIVRLRNKGYITDKRSTQLKWRDAMRLSDAQVTPVGFAEFEKSSGAEAHG